MTVPILKGFAKRVGIEPEGKALKGDWVRLISVSDRGLSACPFAMLIKRFLSRHTSSQTRKMGNLPRSLE